MTEYTHAIISYFFTGTRTLLLKLKRLLKMTVAILRWCKHDVFKPHKKYDGSKQINIDYILFLEALQIFGFLFFVMSVCVSVCVCTQMYACMCMLVCIVV